MQTNKYLKLPTPYRCVEPCYDLFSQQGTNHILGVGSLVIKYLVADGRFDYLETGSLIRLKRNVQDIIIPSEEDHIEMFPLDFEEFLWAMGDEATYPLIRHCFENRAPHSRYFSDELGALIF